MRRSKQAHLKRAGLLPLVNALARAEVPCVIGTAEERLSVGVWGRDVNAWVRRSGETWELTTRSRDGATSTETVDALTDVVAELRKIL